MYTTSTTDECLLQCSLDMIMPGLLPFCSEPQAPPESRIYMMSPLMIFPHLLNNKSFTKDVTFRHFDSFSHGVTFMLCDSFTVDVTIAYNDSFPLDVTIDDFDSFLIIVTI